MDAWSEAMVECFEALVDRTRAMAVRSEGLDDQPWAMGNEKLPFDGRSEAFDEYSERFVK